MDEKKKKTKVEIPIQELLDKTVAKANPFVGYANHARLALMNTELFIDFVLVSPSIPGFEPSAEHVQRVIFPVQTARSLINALEQVVSNWEADNKKEDAE